MNLKNSPDASGAHIREKTYRTLWRWHFCAGVLVAPILIWASVTGALFVFVNEIEPWLYQGLMFVESEGPRASLDEQRASANSYIAGPEAGSVAVPAEPSRATEFYFRENHDRLRIVYVNPHTSEVIGSRVFQDGFFEIVRTLHRSMFIGMPGRILMELATSWGIVLLLTGIYLWWPRKKNCKTRTAMRGIWTPRLNTGVRIALRDVHALAGMYFSPVAVVIMFTGLFFSLVWGTGFLITAQATDSLPDVLVDPPHSVPSDNPPVAVQQILEAAQTRDPDVSHLSISFPHDEQHGYTVNVGTSENPTERAIYVVDQYSGEVLTRTDISNASAMLIARSFAYPLHVGSIGGLATKLLAFLACLVIVLSTVTGLWMWWRSRPDAETGLPKRSSGYRVRPSLLGLLCVTGIAFPTVGISFVIVLILERLSVLFTRSASA